MKPAATSVLAVFGVISCLAGVRAGYVPDDCLDCICRVLSPGCRTPSPPCELSGFLVCGPYKLSRSYWLDARKEGGELMNDWQSCAVSWTCSRQAVDAYMRRYASGLGRDPTCEDFSRIHLGGPNGYLSDTTLQFWEMVDRCLQGDPQFLQVDNMSGEERNPQWEL